MDLSALYTELILEHSRSGEHKRELSVPTCSHRGHNPSCGDDITLQLKIKDGQIEDASFQGVGCAISQASASMMIDLIKGRGLDEATKLAETFLGMIKKEVTDEKELEGLEDLIVFQSISNMPARVKCAVLAWHTLKEALSETYFE